MNGSISAASAPWLFAAALAAYLLGGLNGAIVTSGLFYHDDIRRYGSGNAGLTNFYRTYGAKRIWLVLFIDVGKAVLAVLFGALVFPNSFGRFVSGFFCMLGHLFPVYYRFKGGKGVLCSAVVLLMLDWRIALACWGTFFILVLATRFVSLGSVCAAAVFPVMTALTYRGEAELSVISLLMAGLVIWAHRANISRLLNGTESKFHLHGNSKKGDKA